MRSLNGKVKSLLFLLCLIMGYSFYTWILQLIYGLGVTGMNRPVFWGFYIVNFVFLIGISAGGIAIASLSHLAKIEKYKEVGKIAEIVAIVSLILAMFAILCDMGRPDRIFNLFIYPQIFSPLVWDVTIIIIYLILCILLLWSSLKKNDRLTKIFSYISIPAFVLVHSVTAWIFGLMKSQPGWYNALLAPLFICSALISGLAMVILAILFVRWAFQIEIEDDIIISLGKYFPILLPLLFYLLFCEFLTISYGGIPIHTAVLGELFGGRFSFIFWFNIIIGIIIPFLLAISPLAKRVKWVSLISILTLLGIFAERVDIILPSFYRPLLITSLVSYVPTWIELSIVAGVYAFGTAFLIIACKIIPIKEE